jgi:tRNA(Ile)-lysidine synthase
MFKEFLAFIKKEKLFSPSQRILLATSGGVDSAVMCELFYKAGLKFGIVHCNFNLRGKESKGDEGFVKKLAARYDVPVHVEQFETKSFARKKNISIQMAARELRYTFFESMRRKFGYDYIATAHHKSDVMETMLLNLTRETGISGLHGILPKREYIIRPILFATRKEIAKFASENKIGFREDSSNREEKYQRNLVRRKIIPVLEKINPDAETAFYQSALRVRDAEKVLFNFINELRKKNVSVKKDASYISINAVASLAGGETVLFELLKPFGFTPDAVVQIFGSAKGISGKQFLSPTHRLIRDRENFIVTTLTKNSVIDLLRIPKVPAKINFNEEIISFSVKDNNKFPVPKTSAVCCLDFDKLKFPLIIRSWKEGDSFVPLGMQQKRKVSDFLIDKKIPLHEKEKVKVVESNGEIICLAGLRINNRFRVTEKTKKILVVEGAK